ncbi:hypothetical protein ACFVYR_18525 [Streptomyces sp. NPDC058284]
MAHEIGTRDKIVGTAGGSRLVVLAAKPGQPGLDLADALEDR